MKTHHNIPLFFWWYRGWLQHISSNLLEGGVYCCLFFQIDVIYCTSCIAVTTHPNFRREDTKHYARKRNYYNLLSYKPLYSLEPSTQFTGSNKYYQYLLCHTADSISTPCQNDAIKVSLNSLPSPTSRGIKSKVKYSITIEVWYQPGTRRKLLSAQRVM